MLASKFTKTVTLPTDPTVTVTIKRLGFLQKQAAQKASQRKAMADLREIGGAEFVKELNELKATDPVAVETGIKDPLVTHDTLTVLIGGVAAWSAPDAVTKETLEQLDELDAEFLAREILALAPKAAPGNAA
jgi:hypothetical protein